MAGKCNLRFDDTNPTKRMKSMSVQIKEDVQWLGFKWNELCWASDYCTLPCMAAACEQFRKGLAYVDDSTPDQIREDRGTLTEPGKESRSGTAAWKRI